MSGRNSCIFQPCFLLPARNMLHQLGPLSPLLRFLATYSYTCQRSQKKPTGSTSTPNSQPACSALAPPIHVHCLGPRFLLPTQCLWVPVDFSSDAVLLSISSSWQLASSAVMDRLLSSQNAPGVWGAGIPLPRRELPL